MSSTQKTTNQNNSGKKQKYYCLYHSNNNTHPTDKCKVLKAQAKCMTASQANKNGGKYKRYMKDDKSTEKDFHSFTADIVEQVMKKMKKSHPNEKAKENFNFHQF